MINKRTGVYQQSSFIIPNQKMADVEPVIAKTINKVQVEN
jgi:hypothetical protein